MREAIEERMELLHREIRAVRSHLRHLEEIAHDLDERLGQVKKREFVIESLLEWMGKDYKYRDMSDAERRQFDLIAVHLLSLMKEQGMQLKEQFE